mmetsp:Transcript_35321/g.88990  ORF Transcript_35321/g.88990 Transcript_35321/m.88990 type:complete len:395 (+) Transcript_35321:83-1267(+)
MARDDNNDIEDSSEAPTDDEPSSASEMGLQKESSHTKAEQIRGSFKSPVLWMLIAGVLLAMCAGIVNVTALLEFGMVVTHVTGHATAVGMRIEGVHFRASHANDIMLSDDLSFVNSTVTSRNLEVHFSKLQQALAIIFSFIFGAFLCGMVIPKNSVHFGGKAFYGVALLGNSFLLVIAAVLTAEGFVMLPACIAACASGLQNAMCTMHLGAVVRTTHVTGTSTDIGSTSGRAVMILIRGKCSRRRLSRTDEAELFVDLAKLRVLLILLGAFTFGNFVGAWCFNFLGAWSFLVAASITGFMGFFYTLFRETLKRNIKELDRSKVADVRLRLHDALRQRRQNPEHHATSDQEEAEEEIMDDIDALVEIVEHEVEEEQREAVEARRSSRRVNTRPGR